MTAPSYKLAFRYNSIFRQYSNFTPLHSVVNSLDLINKICHLKPPSNCQLVSFDVSSLFSNVPLDKTLKLASELLLNNHTHPTMHDEIMEALSICTSQNYFTFNSKIYKQTTGLAMGSPPFTPVSRNFHECFRANNIYLQTSPP